MADRIAAATGRRVLRLTPLHGGCIAEVYRADLDGGTRVAVKVDRGRSPQLGIEAFMLRYLRERSRLPVPDVLHGDDDLLVLEFAAGSSGFDPDAERHAAELLADLHGVTADRFGLDRDTLLGPLPLPNPWTRSWIDFFREHRLLHFARLAMDAGQIERSLVRRLETLGAALAGLIREPPAPSLVHGDVWSGNVLAGRGRITAFLDPAIAYAHPEIDLAFITLFGTFGEAFFDRYHERRPIPEGFWEVRRHIYNLPPLLVHAHLFGGHYPGSIDSSLRRLGF